MNKANNRKTLWFKICIHAVILALNTSNAVSGVHTYITNGVSKWIAVHIVSKISWRTLIIDNHNSTIMTKILLRLSDET